MRNLWLVGMFLSIVGMLIVTESGMASVKSAVQASQLYDQASMWFLAMIALTLAVWFAADGRRDKPRNV